ncbi:maleylpyruvate isomerase family mycothiol-dependent enzyme [Streptomyces sp. NPDC002851]
MPIRESLTVERHLDVLRDAGSELAAAAEKAGLDAPVPSCPGWTVRDLLEHTGGVHRWAAAYVTGRRTEPFPRAEVDELIAPPSAGTSPVTWYRDRHTALVEALATADPELKCWAFLPASSPLAFWARRQAHETTVHRVDAQLAAGQRPSVATDVAVCGLDELLGGFWSRPDRAARLLGPTPRTLALRATDAEASWRIQFGTEDLVVVRHDNGDPVDCRLSGPAEALYLLLWNRTGTSGLDVDGDATLLDLWQDKAQVRWG